MILHFFVGDLFCNSLQRNLQLIKLCIKSEDEREFTLSTSDIMANGLVRFNQTIHLHFKNEQSHLMKLTVSVCSVSFENTDISLGTSELVFNPQLEASTKTVSLRNMENKMCLAKLNITIFSNPKAMYLGNEVLLERRSYKPNAKEFEFLLSRRTRDASRKSPRLVSFNENLESKLDAVLTSDGLLAQQRRTTAAQSCGYSVSGIVRRTERTKKAICSPPKLRDTVMSVAYVQNKWPAQNDGALDKLQYRSRLLEERQISLTKEIAHRKRKQFLDAEVKAAKLHFKTERVDLYKQLLQKILIRKETEIKQLQARIKSSSSSFVSREISIGPKTTRTTRDVAKIGTKTALCECQSCSMVCLSQYSWATKDHLRNKNSKKKKYPDGIKVKIGCVLGKSCNVRKPTRRNCGGSEEKVNKSCSNVRKKRHPSGSS